MRPFNRNMTFCDFYPACADQQRCPKKLTTREEEKAKEVGKDINKYLKAPSCFKEVPYEVLAEGEILVNPEEDVNEQD